jgi:Secretion system C-terminal sorting domain
MKRILTLTFFCILGISNIIGQTTLATWTFESVTVASTAGSALSISTGSSVADIGSLTTGSAVSAFHTSSATVYSNPAGNGTVKSLSSNTWAVGDYYQFKVATTGYNDIALSWDQTGSNTGPAPFKVQYSTTAGGASGYMDFSTYTIPNNPSSTPTAGATYSWSPTTPITATSFTANLSAITALNNKSEVYFRLVCTGTVAIGATSTFGTGGTNRIDNFTIKSLTIIPVQLLDFKAQKENQAVKLLWSTATELNNAFYAVERSENGKSFEKIGEINGYGNSNVKRTYEFMDEKPLNTVNYYRLRQVDFDGKETVYKTVSVNFGKNTTTKVYPSIAKDNINVEINGGNGASDLLVVNLLGQVVKAQKLQNTEGVFPVNISDLPNGSYIMRVVSKNETISQRFEKQ